MKVIVVEENDIGGSITSVYTYTKKKYREMVKNEYNVAKKYDRVENDDEVKEWLEETRYGNDIPADIDIIESDIGIHYTVCEVEE